MTAEPLAVVIPLRRQVAGLVSELDGRAERLGEFAWDVAIGPRTMTTQGFDLDAEQLGWLAEWLPNLSTERALIHLKAMVDWADQARQFADSNHPADRDDHADAMEKLQFEAATAVLTDRLAAGVA